MQTIIESTETITTAQNSANDFEDELAEFFTVDDLEKLSENDFVRYELIEGEIIMSTAPRFIHQLVVSRLHTKIALYLDKNPIGLVLQTPGLIFNKFNSVIPDFIYVSQERLKEILQDEMLRGAPEIVVEVLSPGKANLRRDKVLKLETYQRFGVSEYWILNPRLTQVEIYRRDDENMLKLSATLGIDDEITSPILPDFVCAVKNLFEI